MFLRIYIYITQTLRKKSVTDRPKCIRKGKADTCHVVKTPVLKGGWGGRSPKHNYDFKSKTQMLPEKQTHAKRKKYSATVSSVLELGAEHTK